MDRAAKWEAAISNPTTLLVSGKLSTSDESDPGSGPGSVNEARGSPAQHRMPRPGAAQAISSAAPPEGRTTVAGPVADDKTGVLPAAGTTSGTGGTHEGEPAKPLSVIERIRLARANLGVE